MQGATKTKNVDSLSQSVSDKAKKKKKKKKNLNVHIRVDGENVTVYRIYRQPEHGNIYCDIGWYHSVLVLNSPKRKMAL